MSDEPNGTLSRWSQRKLAARHGAVIDEPPPEKNSLAPPEQALPATAGQQNSATAAPADETDISNLPPVEELTFQSDYTAFLRENVPENLRRAALRKLWTSDPLFGFIDMLDDYCEDFNVIDTPITLAQTSYKVGKGYLDEVEEAVAKLEPEVAKLEPENTGEAESKSSAESPGEPTSDEDSVADEGPDELRQLAAAAPEAGEFPQDSETTDRAAPVDQDSGPRRRS